MKSRLCSTAVLIASLFLPAAAQHHQHAPHHDASSGHRGAYAGMQDRDIKALSDQQLAGLRDGRGMGMAMPAELNGYPGPMHVLQLASQLHLSKEQEARTRQLYAEMLTQAKAAGEAVIAAERDLDALFADRQANSQNVEAGVAKAAIAQGKLRETHLRYHLTMTEVLTADQVAKYNKLRGY